MASTTSAPPPSRTKFSRTFQRVITFNKSTKSPSNNAFCLHLPGDKFMTSDKHFNKQMADEAEVRNRAAMEAFVAKLFATVSSLKAAYAELQASQFPYDGEGVKSADQTVVEELKEISDLKRSFMKKQIDASPPHVTLLLSEIKEQQSLMKMYQITMKTLEKQIKLKDSKIYSLKKLLIKANSINKLAESRLNSSRCFPMFDDMNLTDLTVTNFIEVLNYAVESIQDFVKLLICDMEAADWNIDAAVNAIEPRSVFPETSYRCFAFESYVSREIFEGFSVRSDEDEEDRLQNFHHFKRLKSLTTSDLLKQNPRSSENPRSSFMKFTRAKYMRLVHPKMEFSFYGNLSQRKTLNAWQFPETAFFGAFAEMARRVWILRCLALSFDEEVSVFRAKTGCRFSNVYMESVVVGDVAGEQRVAFTVVPGFKIGEKVVQSQVYISPVDVDSGRNRS